jgi:hypothetical protein
MRNSVFNYDFPVENKQSEFDTSTNVSIITNEYIVPNEKKLRVHDWKWGIAGYAEALHHVIEVLLREQEELEYLVRRGIDARQTALLPKLGWGNKETLGCFKSCLNVLADMRRSSEPQPRTVYGKKPQWLIT